jgi:aryl-alcohol dehydrogenase-like predicted oxidoreductase
VPNALLLSSDTAAFSATQTGAGVFAREETLEAWDEIVKAGKARYIGASSMYAWEFSKALHLQTLHGWTRFVAAMQDHYNLLAREEEREMLPLCADSDRATVEAVGAAAAARGVNQEQVALAWLRRNPVVVAPLVGASSTAQIEDAVASLDIDLTNGRRPPSKPLHSPRRLSGRFR